MSETIIHFVKEIDHFSGKACRFLGGNVECKVEQELCHFRKLGFKGDGLWRISTSDVVIALIGRS